MKRAFVTGITGQDGSYLAELLLEKGYEVYGMIRRGSVDTKERLNFLLDEKKNKDFERFHLVDGDITDSINIAKLISDIQPSEIYNLAAQSYVAVSFTQPEYTANVDAIGTLRVLEAVLMAKLEKKTKIYQASTSELFGKVEEIPQRETTPFHPRSPYGVAKMYAYWITKHYREAYGIFASNGILFNHESERRGKEFVTRKITLAASRISLGLQQKLYLGNLSAKRDWGYAKDYVECMWKILQHNVPDDFVIATGVTHSVREFCTLAFKNVGIEIEWVGQGVDEKGINKNNGEVIIEVKPEYFRPAEVDLLLGCPEKAEKLLGWNAQNTSFEELVSLMVRSDLQLTKRELIDRGI